MMKAVESYKLECGADVEIFIDEDCESPRQAGSNLGTLRLNSGGRHFSEVMEGQTVQDFAPNDVFLTLEIYAYVHGNVAFSTAPFGNRFDSWRTGYIYVTRANVEEILGRPVTEEDRERVSKILAQEVATYGQWVNGETYGFRVKYGKKEDECWGFIGIKDVKDDAQACAEAMIMAAEAEEAEEEVSDVQQSARDWINGNRKDIIERVKTQSSTLGAGRFVCDVIGEIEGEFSVHDARKFRAWFSVHGGKS